MNTAQYETTLILTPDKSDSEVNKLTRGYVKFLKTHGAKVIHDETWGLRNFTYPIRKKNTGYYFTMEFEGPTDIVANLELSLKRDEDVLRFLTIKLDKFAIDYNERRRKGLIGRDKHQPAKPAHIEAAAAPVVAQTEKAVE